MIFNMSQVDIIDFSQVLETSQDTLRLSVDGSKSFIKWDGGAPSFLGELTTSQGPYNYSQMIEILQTPEWTSADQGV